MQITGSLKVEYYSKVSKKLSASSTSPKCSWTFLNIRLNVKNVFVFIFFFTTANFCWFHWNERNLLQNNGLQLIKEVNSLTLSSNYRQITLLSWLLNYGNKKHFSNLIQIKLYKNYIKYNFIKIKNIIFKSCVIYSIFSSEKKKTVKPVQKN